jgi:hypothetical protein
MTSRRERSSANGEGLVSIPITPVNDKESPNHHHHHHHHHHQATDLASTASDDLATSRPTFNDMEQNDNIVTDGPRRVLFGDTCSPKRSILARRNNNNHHLGGFTTSSTTSVIAVTPSPQLQTDNKNKNNNKRKDFTTNRDNEQTIVVVQKQNQPSAKRRLLFGRHLQLLECPANVEAVYKIVRKFTGNMGGNGYSGPIYGELTMYSMQKMINLMVKTTSLNMTSRFIDVGSGIGKPNLHVAQSPGVAFSCGVEIQHTRWALGMTCLKACLDVAVAQQQQQQLLGNDDDNNNHQTKNAHCIGGNTMFLHKNITEANTFDPFTHVYMFSIGFPPELWLTLSEQWNNSKPDVCRYLICYHGPKDIIENYGFEVDLIAQTTTSMHGSKETHTGYIYHRRTSDGGGSGRGTTSASPKRHGTMSGIACDPLFKSSFKLVQEGLQPLQREVHRQMQDFMGGSGRITRSRRRHRMD